MKETEILKKLKYELEYILKDQKIKLEENTKNYYVMKYLETIITYIKINKISSIMITYNKKENYEYIIENKTINIHKIQILINSGTIKISDYFIE